MAVKGYIAGSPVNPFPEHHPSQHQHPSAFSISQNSLAAPASLHNRSAPFLSYTHTTHSEQWLRSPRFSLPLWLWPDLLPQSGLPMPRSAQAPLQLPPPLPLPTAFPHRTPSSSSPFLNKPMAHSQTHLHQPHWPTAPCSHYRPLPSTRSSRLPTSDLSLPTSHSVCRAMSPGRIMASLSWRRS